MDRNEQIPGQLDFDGAVTAGTPEIRRGKMRLIRGPVKPGEPPRYLEYHANTDCDACFDDQWEADRAHRPVGRRRRAKWCREAYGQPTTYLCREHGQERHTRDRLGKL